MILYLIGSLRQQHVPDIGNALRQAGHEVYDDWFAGGREADDEWQRYEKRRGRSFVEALDGWAAKQVFEHDLRHLKRADAGVLVMPAGKSAHLELGWMIGQGKPGYILMDKEPDRMDVMYRFATGVYMSLPELLHALSGAGRRSVDHAPWNS
jgi:hypothetical protein